jgi:peptidase E
LSSRQPIYLFAGGRGGSILTTFAKIREIIKSLGKEKPEIAYVGVASLKDNRLIYMLISALIKSGCKCRVRQAAIASPKADLNKARKILKRSDVVFFSGGDVEVGMQVLEERKMVGYFRELAKDGKIFLGVSAGSILMSREWVRWRDPRHDETAEIFPCLGLAPVICDTHAEQDDWVELKTLLALEKPGTAGYGLTSGSFVKVYPNGGLEVAWGTVANFIQTDKGVIRQADLTPASNKTG